jgi:hypothetical protein
MKRISLPLILVVFAIMRGYAQASLGFVNVQPTPPNVAINDTLKFGATIYNYGNVPFNDSIVFGLLHNGSNIANPTIFPRPYPGPPTVHMNQGDSIRLDIAIVVTSTDFVVGPTGVVIWPIAHNQVITVHDSISTSFNITQATGINDLKSDENQFQSIFLNGALRVTTPLSNDLLQEVNLYSVTGQLLFTSHESLPINIPVENYPAGVYLLQFRLQGGEQITRKVFIPTSK